MKMYCWSFLFLTLMLVSCSGECPMKQALETQTAELEKVSSQLDDMKRSIDINLMHVVFIKLQEAVTEEEKKHVKNELLSLSVIEGVKFLHVGEPAETSDPRLNKDYTFALQVGFKSESDLAAYQTNDLHVSKRDAVKHLFAGPPVVYDYWVK